MSVPLNIIQKSSFCTLISPLNEAQKWKLSKGLCKIICYKKNNWELRPKL
jgi:hypothetical protein